MRWVLVLLLAHTLAAAPGLEERIKAILAASPAAQRAFWGIHVVSLKTGETLYASGHDRPFVPASNTKLFSAALALARLGPDHRFVTTVVAAAAPGKTGRIVGDVRLVGGGDPTLSARVIPYRKDAEREGDPLRAIEQLADAVSAAGVKRIEGDILGDDTAYPWAPFAEGWAQDDSLWEYGAPVSALTLNDNAVTISARPGPRSGDPAILVLSPAMEYYLLDNRVTTGGQGPHRIGVDRGPGSRQLRIWGSVGLGSPGSSRLLAVDDPALYAACALYDALTRRGIAVAGGPRARHRYVGEVRDLKGDTAADRPEAGFVLARRESPALAEVLRIVLKVSQNLHAEMTLREVGRVRRNIGSREAGLEELRAFLKEAGIGPESYNFEDGSGLSRLNLVTPEAITRLLGYMYSSGRREAWLGLFPIGGGDGTLKSRFDGHPAAARIRAKTGTLSHVSSLSGYVETAGGETLAFAILANNYNTSASEIRRTIDRIVIQIAEQEGAPGADLRIPLRELRTQVREAGPPVHGPGRTYLPFLRR